MDTIDAEESLSLNPCLSILEGFFQLTKVQDIFSSVVHKYFHQGLRHTLLGMGLWKLRMKRCFTTSTHHWISLNEKTLCLHLSLTVLKEESSSPSCKKLVPHSLEFLQSVNHFLISAPLLKIAAAVTKCSRTGQAMSSILIVLSLFCHHHRLRTGRFNWATCCSLTQFTLLSPLLPTLTIMV